jgi:hypothetical protein
LTTVLDVTSLLLTGIEGVNPGQAKLTFAMARHAAVDLSQVVNAWYDPAAPERLPEAEYEALHAALESAGLKLRSDDYGREKLAKLRSMYEPYAHGISRNLMMTLPPFRHPQKLRDNWQVAPWDRLIQAQSLAILGQKPRPQTEQIPELDHF